MECSVDGCANKAKYKATGWCQTHYHRNYRTGSIDLMAHTPRADLTYFGAHGRVKRRLGPADDNPCVKCGAAAKEWAYDGTDPSELSGVAGEYPVTYSAWPEFYMPLCHPCHRLMDRSAWATRRTHCTHGHEMTEENTYTRPSRPGTKECLECKRIEAQGRKKRRRKK